MFKTNIYILVDNYNIAVFKIYIFDINKIITNKIRYSVHKAFVNLLHLLNYNETILFTIIKVNNN